MAGFGAAAASLEDDTHVRVSRDFVRKTRSFFQGAFESMGLETISGPPPFILVDVGERAGEIRDALVRRKIFVRDGKEWDLPHHLRISYGLEEENRRFLKAFRALS